MDALTFGSSVLLRHMTFSEARKMPIQEFHLSKVLEELELAHSEFIDMCILLGCDYCDSIRGIGPKRAIDLIKQYRNIETIIENLDKKKYSIPENWPFKEARRLFMEPEVADPETLDVNNFFSLFCVISPMLFCLHCLCLHCKFSSHIFQLKWTEPNEEGLIKYLCGDKNFNEERVRNGVKKLVKARTGTTQGRLDSFFKVLTSPNAAQKRKVVKLI